MALPLGPDPSFDYRTASQAVILERAKLLEGRLVGDIEGASFTATEGARGRAEVGHAVERFFGIPRNARPEADFPGAGIELKVVPLLRRGNTIRVKERTVLAMIDYFDLVVETWETASVRKKLRILFVFFEHIPDAPKTTFPFRATILWEPDAATTAFLRADWERVDAKIRHGLAHELSESDGRIMGPCTKAADSTVLRAQPFSDIPAKPRAFALKPAFTFDLYQRTIRKRVEESLVANEVSSPTAAFEEQLLRRFERFVGRTVDDVAAELGVPPSNAKSYAAAILRRTFGAKSFKSRLREFEELGLTPRITRVGPDLMPYEALSFPAFRYRELLEEVWEDSDLLSRVEYMLLVPLRGESKATLQPQCRFERPIFWRPNPGQLETIREEWETYRIEIRAGWAGSLTPESGTQAIHVRPHARDSDDVDLAPGVGLIVKKSFWLNRRFVQSLLTGEATQ